jgi:hypothetical protein
VLSHICSTRLLRFLQCFLRIKERCRANAGGIVEMAASDICIQGGDRRSAEAGSGHKGDRRGLGNPAVAAPRNCDN